MRTNRGSILIAVMSFAVLVGVSYAHLDMGYSLTRVLTGSMAPHIGVNDLIVTRTVPVTTIETGDIPVFVPDGEEIPRAHRVIGVEFINGTAHLNTQGDANPVPDANISMVSGDVPEVVGVLRIGHLIALPNHITILVLGLSATLAACISILTRNSSCAECATDRKAVSHV